MSDSAQRSPLSTRSKILLAIVVLVGVILPLQFWHSVWFGRELGDEEMGRYLAGVERPREIQHALARLEEKIRAGEPGVAKWYPQVAGLADHPSWMVRNQAAWVMGQDAQARIFHDALRRLVGDADPVVRRNAALALARHGDRQAALPELRRMLRPVGLLAPEAGKPEFKVGVGDLLQAGDPVAEVGGEQVVSRFPGRVLWLASPAEETVSGAELARISPDPLSVWEALRALFLIGETEDLKLVESIADDPGFDEQIRAQARNTREAILSR